MTKYLSQYVPEKSTNTAPIRKLPKKDADWNWTPEQEAAIMHFKAALTLSPTSAFHNVDEPVTIQADASQHGRRVDLALVYYKTAGLLPMPLVRYHLLKRIMHRSRKRCSQSAIVFATSKFHQYIFGKEVVIYNLFTESW